MFYLLGRGLARHPVPFILVWVVLLAGAATVRVVLPPHVEGEVGSFLPPGSPHNISSDIIKEALPRAWSNSTLVVVTHRKGGLAPEDFDFLDTAGAEAGRTLNAPYLSPKVPFLRERLVSRDREAALMVINLPSNFISEGTIHAVDAVDKIIRRDPPAGLTLEITGTAGIGHDYFLATQKAVDRTTWVTVIAVLAILVIVYRSPIGALVPLVSIGASVYVAFVVLALLSRLGWGVSAMERIFCVVLMFGAGVDYALFWIARYREGLAEQAGGRGAPPQRIAGEGVRDRNLAPATGAARPDSTADVGRGSFVPAEVSPPVVATHRNPRSAAAFTAMREAGPAILASAATTICGLTTMLAADLVPSRNAGRVLAVALTIALLAALTLAPALARWLGQWLFWPMGVQREGGLGQRILWPWLARKVAHHPRPVLFAGTALLTVFAVASLQYPPRFDALQELPPDTSSARGFEIAKAHFEPGQLYPNYILAVYAPGERPKDMTAASRAITQTIAAHPAVSDVYSLDRPLGRSANRLLGQLVSSLAGTLYEGTTKSGQTVLRFELLMGPRAPGGPAYMPFSPEAITAFEEISASVRRAIAQEHQGAAPQIMLAGPTSYIIGVKSVVGADQRRVMVLATLVITVIVFVMVRDAGLTVFMILSTWLTYGATITLTNLFLVHVMGLGGLDWKVRLILFVIVVAVGQDYNIFLVSRLVRRGLRVEEDPAEREERVREAIVRTGSVISSCGLIMAATLGSLWAGGLSLLRQLGFALALGILIDTFFVRPLLIPGFYLAFGRRGRHAE